MLIRILRSGPTSIFDCLRMPMPAPPCTVADLLSGRGLVEQLEAFGDRQDLPVCPTSHPDACAVDDPLDIVAGTNTEAIGDSLGDRHLEFAGDLGHVFAMTRTASLLKHGSCPRLPP